ncbi:MAG: T9SS type A sorting domain-containing protein [Thermoplasmata archaeon]|nr:T9SS type A sorting domain-containing protein [Thermoplasmata archaeon]
MTDPGGAWDQCNATVTVIDDTPPLINTIIDPIILWPNNHQYAMFGLSDFVLAVSDNCASLSINDVIISSASSDEPDAGGAYGNKPDDIVISADCKSIQLRRERFGGDNGRVYTVNLELEDNYGNVGFASCQVHVPKNPNTIAIDDGPAHEVYGDCGDKSTLFTDKRNNGKLKVYPNPFRERIIIEYYLVTSVNVIITVFNHLGIQIESIDQGNLKGKLQYVWSAASLPRGFYYVQVKAGQEITVRKIIKM